MQTQIGFSNGENMDTGLFSLDKPPSLESFRKLIAESKPIHYPLAASIEKNIPIYDLPAFSSLTTQQQENLQAEWRHILAHGPGVFVTKRLYKDIPLLERVNDIYSSIIAEEESKSGKRGDHFAGAGANHRIWNSFSKHGIKDPHSFVEYYSNPWLPLICSSWLGPYSRLTAQVNIVKPGGKAQVPHRDYHMGFLGTFLPDYTSSSLWEFRDICSLKRCSRDISA